MTTAIYIKVSGSDMYYCGGNSFSTDLKEAEAFACDADVNEALEMLAATQPGLSVNKVQKQVPGSDDSSEPMGSDDGPEAGEGTSAEVATSGDTQQDGAAGDFPRDDAGGDDDPKGADIDPAAEQVEPHDDSEFGTGDNEDGSRQLGDE